MVLPDTFALEIAPRLSQASLKAYLALKALAEGDCVIVTLRELQTIAHCTDAYVALVQLQTMKLIEMTPGVPLNEWQVKLLPMPKLPPDRRIPRPKTRHK